MNRLLFFCCVCLTCCQNIPTNQVMDYNNVPYSTAFAAGIHTGDIQGNFVKELSGIAASRLQSGMFWIHADGQITEIYLIDSLGNRIATLPLPTDTPTVDCEDIATGWLNGKAYIFLADIGDNKGKNSTHSIYGIPEPALSTAPRPVTFPAPTDMQTLTFSYPDQHRYNAESLLFDPKTKSLLVATKGNTTSVFVLPMYPWPDTPVTAQKVAELPIDRATAGDISSDGLEILLKNKTEIYYWVIPEGGSASSILADSLPQRAPYTQEIQGEAIGFNNTNTGYLTSTERGHATAQPIWFYPRK